MGNGAQCALPSPVGSAFFVLARFSVNLRLCEAANAASLSPRGDCSVTRPSSIARICASTACRAEGGRQRREVQRFTPPHQMRALRRGV